MSRGQGSLPGFRASRSESSARSKRSGDSAEEFVDGLHRSRPFCDVWALYRRFSLQQGGEYIGAQGPDFSGWHRKSARHVEVEVKRVPSGGLTFARIHKRCEKKPTYDSPQVRVLRDCAHDGGLAVVLVLHGPVLAVARWCAVPWAAIEERVLAHAAHTTRLLHTPEALRKRVLTEAPPASISAEELLRYAVTQSDRYLEAPWFSSPMPKETL